MPPKKKDETEPSLRLGRPKNDLKMGLVGLPNVGKSTTFNVLANQSVPAENFPFCTVDPHEARMHVPDERFKWLCGHFKPKSEVSATLTIFDIAGLVKGASEGEGMGNAFLSHIQQVDGIFHVVRAFEDDDIIHNEGEVNPVADLQAIYDELRLKDINQMERLIEDLTKQTSRGDDKYKKAELAFLKSSVTKHLTEDKKWISDGEWKMSEIEYLNDFHFLTAKPVVYLVNLSQKDFARQKNKWLSKIAEWVKTTCPGPVVPYSADFELKLSGLSDDAERAATIKEAGAQKSMVEKIINTGYSALALIHFFTCGDDEVKCWTVRVGTKAPAAGGVIHTDFEKGFISADVYKYSDLVEYGSESKVKSAGKVFQKGKNYVVEDGDVIFFKFNPSGGGAKK